MNTRSKNARESKTREREREREKLITMKSIGVCCLHLLSISLILSFCYLVVVLSF
jgi:nitrate reductase NapE component